VPGVLQYARETGRTKITTLENVKDSALLFREAFGAVVDR